MTKKHQRKAALQAVHFYDAIYEGDNEVKIRQILASLAIVLIHNTNILSDLLDTGTFEKLHANHHILEELSYWLNDPNRDIPRTDENDEIMNLMVSFLKRAVKKNIRHNINYVYTRDEGGIITYKGQKI